MTIEELKQYCSDEFNKIESAQSELFNVYAADKSEYTVADHAAIAAFMMNIYTGTENVLKQILLYDKLDVKDAPKWHEKVLTKSAEIGILPPELFQALSKYLSFRHYFIYSYVSDINWEDLKALVDSVKEMTGNLRSEVEEYLQTF